MQEARRVAVAVLLSSFIFGCREGADPVTPAVSVANAVSTIGKVMTTSNPQVAAYSVSGSAGNPVIVEFGVDTSYPFKTWSQTIASDGQTKILVAGMKARTTYHMRAVTTLQDGTQSVDSDHIFTTG